MNIEGLDKAAVLAALYNASKPQGMGFMQYSPKPMTVEDARKLIDAGHLDFDYLSGRVMKISLRNAQVDTWGYNRDVGEGAAERAVDVLRATQDPNAASIQSAHREGVSKSVRIAEAAMEQKTEMTEPGVIRMGLADVAPELRQAIKERVIEPN